MNSVDSSPLPQYIIDALEHDRLDKHYRELAEQPYPTPTFPFIPPAHETSSRKRAEHVVYISPTVPTH